MTQKYTVRDEVGKMLAKIGTKIVNQIIVNCVGHWTTSKRGYKCFYVDDNYQVTAISGDIVYFWEGYTITEDKQ